MSIFLFYGNGNLKNEMEKLLVIQFTNPHLILHPHCFSKTICAFNIIVVKDRVNMVASTYYDI